MILSSVEVFATPHQAATAFARRTPLLGRCVMDTLAKVFKGMVFDRSSVPLHLAPVGARSRAYHVRMRVHIAGPGTYTVDLVIAQSGRVVATVVYFGVGKPIDPKTEREAAVAVGRRMTRG